MRRSIYHTLLACIITVISGTAPVMAATEPRELVSINRPVVKLKDLFSNTGTQGNQVLGPAPAPGSRIKVGAAQLTAIAKEYGATWKNIDSNSSVIIERPGTPVSQSAIIKVLRPALIGAGAMRHFVIQLTSGHPPMIPPGEQPKILVSRVAYHRLNNTFRAYVMLTAPKMVPRRVMFSGIVEPAQRAVIARHALAPGEIIGNADVALKWVAQSTLLHGALTAPKETIGMQVDRRIPIGTPLTRGAIGQPMMVDRGATVNLVVSLPNLKVTAEGIALAAGGKGTVIPVLNPNSHEVVQAVIDGRNHAHVLPGSQPTPSRGQVPYYSMMSGRK